jgi:hypothetical protein
MLMCMCILVMCIFISYVQLCVCAAYVLGFTLSVDWHEQLVRISAQIVIKCLMQHAQMYV